MATVTERSPIIFLLLNGLIPTRVIIFDSPGIVKPSDISMQRPARYSLFNTASAAFLNNFFEGYATIQIAGNTGWGGSDPTIGYSTGFFYFKALENLFSEYLRETQVNTASEGQLGKGVVLLYIDTINFEAASVYPTRFVLRRSNNRPHLFYYDIQLVVLDDLFEDAVFAVTDILSTIGTNIVGLLPSFGAVTQGITNVFAAALEGLSQEFGSLSKF